MTLSARTNTGAVLSPLVACSSAGPSAARETGSSPSASERSGLTVRKSGLGGRCCCGASAVGRLTEMSTVASGAATMKMMSRTSITSMKGVTLISWTSSSSSLPWSRRTLIVCSSLGRRRDRLAGAGATIEVAARQPQRLGRGIGELGPVGGDLAGEHIIDDDRGDRRRQPEGGRQQGFGYAGRDHRQIGGLRLRDADEAVHDAPD